MAREFQSSARLVDLGVQAEIIEKSGAWFSCEGQRIGQGRENAKQFLKENTAMADMIEKKIRANAGLVAEAMMGTPEPDAEGTMVDA